MGEKRGMQALEAWCRQVTAGYNGVKVTNMTTSWKNGLAFCALVHHFRPDLIDFASLSAENIYHNNQLAFSVAENFLGIPALLDAEDMVNYVPDRLSIMTYVSQFYQVLAAPKIKGGSHLSIGLKRPVDRAAVGSSASGCDSPDSSATTGSVTPVKVFSQQLQNGSEPSKWQQQARRISELCVACKNSVFLAERLMVNGRLHHRVCFRCARCRSQLSLANYYETEQEQYCCETCPDEVVPTIPEADTKSDKVMEVSSSSSAIAITSEPISSGQYVSSLPHQQFNPPSDQQHRHFLDSIVCPHDDEEVSRNPADEHNEDVKKDYPQATFFVSVDENRTGITGDVMVSVGDVVATDMPTSVYVSDQDNIASDDDQVGEHVVVPDSVTDEVHVADEKCLTIKSEAESAKVLAPIGESLDEEPVSQTGQEIDDSLTESVEKLNKEKENIGNVTSDELSAVILPDSEKSIDKQLEHLSVEGESNPFALPVSQVTADEDDSTQTVVPELRRRQKNKRSTTPQKKVVQEKSIDQYPEELNPFEDEPQTEGVSINPSSELDRDDHKTCLGGSGTANETPKNTVPTPKISLNPFGSDDEDEEKNNSIDSSNSSEKVRPGRPPPPLLKTSSQSMAIVNPSPSPKKRPAPAPPPPPKPQRTPNLASSRETGSISRRKSAPPPPNPELVTKKSSVPTSTTELDVTRPVPSPEHGHNPATSSESPVQNVSDNKTRKDLSNFQLQSSVNKDLHGQWKRKKGPAPPRPSPQKRQLRKLPLKEIQKELDDIEIRQLLLERRGVDLEKDIRRHTEPEDGNEPIGDGIYIEEIILHLFDLVNEKNELLHRQTELMYIRRQQRLEEEHAELEFQIRCLMEKPKSEKTDEDRSREEELIERLVQVVHRRAEIVDSLEMDRRRQEEEDESIQQHLDVFNTRAATAVVDPFISPSKTKSKSIKLIQSPIKLLKKDKVVKKSKKIKADQVNVDKETDESQVTNTSPSNTASDSSSPLKKNKNKTKAKTWFAK